jgi:ATP adenylyltransferase
MTYVATAGAPENPCIFCAALDGPDERHSLILHRSTRAFLILNAYPYAVGHLMAAPVRHVAGLEAADSQELVETMTLVQVGIRALGAAYRPDGFNIGVNQGRVAGAGVLGHVHVHVVPRWNGDTNFMPVIAGTKVLSESLTSSYDRLRAALSG